jgi:hypothetical protein
VYPRRCFSFGGGGAFSMKTKIILCLGIVAFAVAGLIASKREQQKRVEEQRALIKTAIEQRGPKTVKVANHILALSRQVEFGTNREPTLIGVASNLFPPELPFKTKLKVFFQSLVAVNHAGLMPIDLEVIGPTGNQVWAESYSEELVADHVGGFEIMGRLFEIDFNFLAAGNYRLEARIPDVETNVFRFRVHKPAKTNVTSP